VVERGYLLVLLEEVLFIFLVLRLCCFRTVDRDICLCTKGSEFLKMEKG